MDRNNTQPRKPGTAETSTPRLDTRSEQVARAIFAMAKPPNGEKRTVNRKP